MKTNTPPTKRKKSTIAAAKAKALAGVVNNNVIRDAPVHLMTSSTPERKMAAIENLSLAILECAKALSSTHVNAYITNCHFSSVETAIRVDG